MVNATAVNSTGYSSMISGTSVGSAVECIVLLALIIITFVGSVSS